MVLAARVSRRSRYCLTPSPTMHPESSLPPTSPLSETSPEIQTGWRVPPGSCGSSETTVRLARHDPVPGGAADHIRVARLSDQTRFVAVYAVCPTDGRVLAVDVASGKVTGRRELADARVATISQRLWVGFADGLAQVDPSTLEVEAVYDVDLDPRRHRFLETFTSSAYRGGGDVLVTSDTLWTTSSDDGVLLQVNPQ